MSLKRMWFGNLLVGMDWASDWKWDWTSDTGDKHSDFAAVARCEREGFPTLYRVTLGPLCFMAAYASDRWKGQQNEDSRGVG
jgi:hypothetical protein